MKGELLLHLYLTSLSRTVTNGTMNGARVLVLKIFAYSDSNPTTTSTDSSYFFYLAPNDNIRPASYKLLDAVLIEAAYPRMLYSSQSLILFSELERNSFLY